MAKRKEDGFVKGKYSAKEEKFIRDNYLRLTDEQIGQALNRGKESVCDKRKKMGLIDKKRKQEELKKKNTQYREAFLATMDDGEKEAYYRKEIKGTSFYKTIKKGALDRTELAFLEDKWIEFRMDPTVESITSTERDTWQLMTLSEIRMLRYMREEVEAKESGERKDVQRQISECQDIIQKCQKSLNVERSQRLKDKNDQAVTFATIIKHLKDPATRRSLGYEAGMMKFIAEAHYNHAMNTNIRSGNGLGYNLIPLFKDGEVPELNVDFTGEKSVK